MRNRINLLNEIGHLAHTPRTGMAFLGTGQQSVAEHCFSVSMICFVLADLCEEPVNLEKLLMLALSHDVAEARTGDLNYMYKRYMKANNEKAYEDLARGSETATKIASYMREFDAEETLEAKLANDADQLEMLLVLKRESDKGNPRAMLWFESVIQRVKTAVGQKLAEEIRVTPSDEWWMTDPKDAHWVHGGNGT